MVKEIFAILLLVKGIKSFHVRHVKPTKTHKPIEYNSKKLSKRKWSTLTHTHTHIQAEDRQAACHIQTHPLTQSRPQKWRRKCEVFWFTSESENKKGNEREQEEEREREGESGKIKSQPALTVASTGPPPTHTHTSAGQAAETYTHTQKLGTLLVRHKANRWRWRAAAWEFH